MPADQEPPPYEALAVPVVSLRGQLADAAAKLGGLRLEGTEIEDPSGRRMAMVKKAMITPVRERWVVKVEDGPDLRAQGNIVDHEYTIERDGDKVAEISKSRWRRVRTTS